MKSKTPRTVFFTLSHQKKKTQKFQRILNFQRFDKAIIGIIYRRRSLITFRDGIFPPLVVSKVLRWQIVRVRTYVALILSVPRYSTLIRQMIMKKKTKNKHTRLSHYSQLFQALKTMLWFSHHDVVEIHEFLGYIFFRAEYIFIKPRPDIEVCVRENLRWFLLNIWTQTVICFAYMPIYVYEGEEKKRRKKNHSRERERERERIMFSFLIVPSYGLSLSLSSWISSMLQNITNTFESRIPEFQV